MTDTLRRVDGGPAPQALLAAGTAAVSDALDRLRVPGSALGIAPLAPGQRLVGPAFTVGYVRVGAA